jgi:hypothetical protein
MFRCAMFDMLCCIACRFQAAHIAGRDCQTLTQAEGSGFLEHSFVVFCRMAALLVSPYYIILMQYSVDSASSAVCGRWCHVLHIRLHSTKYYATQLSLYSHALSHSYRALEVKKIHTLALYSRTRCAALCHFGRCCSTLEHDYDSEEAAPYMAGRN